MINKIKLMTIAPKIIAAGTIGASVVIAGFGIAKTPGYQEKASSQSMTDFIQNDGLNAGFACPPPDKDEFVKSIKQGTSELTYTCPDGVRDLIILPKKGTIQTVINSTGQKFSEQIKPSVVPLDLLNSDLKSAMGSGLKKVSKIFH